jgi:hypothetical protein
MGAYTRPSRMKKRKLGSCKKAHDSHISMRHTFEVGAKTGLPLSKGTTVPRSLVERITAVSQAC